MLNDECSILLIDDDVDVLDAYTQMLEQAGYRVRGFTHPFEAKEWVEADWEGIVLSDVCMPGCSGIQRRKYRHEYCSKIRLQLPRIRF